MARFEVLGVEALIGGLEDMAESVPKLRDEILEAEADVVEPAIKKSIMDCGLVRSGRLLRSITRKKTKSGGVPAIKISPEGEHHRYLPSKGKSGVVSAGYVGYLNEYGLPSRGIKARKFLERAIAKSKGPAYDAADAVYYKYQQKNKL